MFSQKPITKFAAPSRRTFLKSASAAGLVSTWPVRVRSMTGATRKSLQSGNAGADVAIYAAGVQAMLDLPPEDPRNWYRHAMTHMMDCPHGNWWFLVWHRGYLAHLENICRELTGETEFALPFWDWTQETKVPASFWQGVLTPTAAGFEPDAASFTAKFRGPMEDYWNSMSTAQMDAQMARGAMIPLVLRYNDFPSFWASMEFHFQSQPRSLTQANPDLNALAKNAVSTSTITDALSPAEFVAGSGASRFESGMTASHHHMATQAIIESQPHNLVHGAIGGQMGAWLSPTDPIFFMHHCNIDRLWHVWARKQAANGLTFGPPAALEAAYLAENFLFFHDAKGDPASLQTAGDYEQIATFGYDYEPGTGEDLVPPDLAVAETLRADAAVSDAAFDIADPARSSLALGEDLAAAMNSGDRRFFAEISIVPPQDLRGLEFLVFIGKAGTEIDTTAQGDNFAGAVSFFGDVSHGFGPAGFTLGITDAVERLRGTGQLETGDKVQVSVVPQAREGSMALSSNAEGALASASIGVL